MKEKSELGAAFDAAIDEVKRTGGKGITTLAGTPGVTEVNQLVTELQAERGRALDRGYVDREWFQKTLKWVVSWLPESDLTVIAALGRIVRVQPKISRKNEPS